jgi:hypothetical protein
MATHRTVNDQDSKPSKYRSLVPLGGAGVIMIVLGFIIGWVWLVWLGFILFLAAAFLTRLWFFGDWIPTLFAAKERDHEDSWNLPPPPTLE